MRGLGVDDVERLPRDHEQDRHDDRRDDGPDQLGDRVAMGLGREAVVARLAPVAQDRVDDQPFDDEEDDRGDEEDEGVQVPDVGALLGHRDRREEALDDPLAGAADQRQDEEQGDADGDEHGREDRARWGARFGSSTSRVLSGVTRDARSERLAVRSRVSIGPRTDRGHDSGSASVTFVRPRPPGRPASVRDGSCDDAAMRRRSVLARAGSVAGPLVVWLAAAPSAAAHGAAPAEPPTLANLLLGWTWEPLPTLAIGVSLVWWWWAVRRVDAAHPANPVPRRRSVAFGLAMLALAFALISGIERYDTTLFSVHMVQHILLMHGYLFYRRTALQGISQPLFAA